MRAASSVARCRSIRRPPRRLDQLTMPVLFVHGALDFSYVETFGRHLEANVPNARLVVIPGVAHLVAVEAPDEIARLVLDLVRPLGDYREPSVEA